jgi:hypothetical protein
MKVITYEAHYRSESMVFKAHLRKISHTKGVNSFKKWFPYL